MADKRKIVVDSYLTYRHEPRITLQMSDGKRHALTIGEVRLLLSDIRSELEDIERERNDNADGSN